MTKHNFSQSTVMRSQWIALSLMAFVLSQASAQVPAPYDPLDFGGQSPIEKFPTVGIEQNLNAQIPLDLIFVDEMGSSAPLSDYLDDKPAVLALVYYSCPSLCTEVLNSLQAVIGAMDYDVGEDYHVLNVSIAPNETPELAAMKKGVYLEGLNKPGAEVGWHFLTGEEQNIETLADIVGFHYTYDPETEQYAHAAGIFVLTPEGRVARYYYGLNYIPRDVEFGLIEASNGKIGNIVKQLLLLCYRYDPTTGKYGIYVIGALRVGATMMILGIGSFWFLHYLGTRKTEQAAT